MSIYLLLHLRSALLIPAPERSIRWAANLDLDNFLPNPMYTAILVNVMLLELKFCLLCLPHGRVLIKVEAMGQP